MSETRTTSEETPPHILVLGASGFIGGHVVAALLQAGFRVLAVRRRHPPRLAPAPTQASGALRWTELSVHRMTQAADWRAALEGASLVINCVGILRQRWGERYGDVHHRMPAALAQACAARGLPLVHTSALGLHEHAASRFLSSKLRGEQAIAASGCDHCIVRPSLIDGLGGFGASWLRMLARWPVHFVPSGAVGRIAAVQAADLGHAYAALARMGLARGLAQQREANLSGPRLFAYAEYLQVLRGAEVEAPVRKRRAWQVPLPNIITRIGAHLCDVFRFSPVSWGHWILLQRDNVPEPNHLPALLGRAPQAVTYERVRLRDDFRLS